MSNFYRLICCLLALSLSTGCQTGKKAKMMEEEIDLQGHRGARGLYPENSIEGFIQALEMGVNTLEMDVVVSADHQLILSHEPWFSHKICVDPQGRQIKKEDEKQWLIYKMTVEEIKEFDCGSIPDARFPAQAKFRTCKPSLNQVIDSVEQFLIANELPPVDYNIETKSKPEWDSVYTPAPDHFVKLLYDVIRKKDLKTRTILQSFDPRTLQAMRSIDSGIRLSLLVENDLALEVNINNLGFQPEIYSPNFRLLNQESMQIARNLGLRVIPWTVNEIDEMQALLELGVDGLITDYPDRGKEAIEAYYASGR
jgi:glycerophosphoryl diester phosphodiesterase